MSGVAQEVVLRAWQQKNVLFYCVLIPLSWLFGVVTALRRKLYRSGILKSYQLNVPVIVVGNINLGGSGKTPAVIWLANELISHGYKPAVISRGYGGSATQSTSVTPASLPSIVGDEPVLIASRCGCPVWVGRDRVQVAHDLLKAYPACNVIISDDGLQHYRLKRDMEIVIVNDDALEAARLLPAGPFREPPSRLNSVDAIVCNGKKTHTSAYQMRLDGSTFYNLANQKMKASVADFAGKNLKAIAGIGKPARFFAHLRDLGLVVEGIGFDDHYAFTAQDLQNIVCDALIMTEKDAVKCEKFAKPNYWVLPVEANIDKALLEKVLDKIKPYKNLREGG